MLKKLLQLILLHVLLCQNDAARILFTAAVDSGTHIGSMVPLIKRLASSGHQITVLEMATLEKPRELGPNISVHFLPVPVDKGIARVQAAAMFREVLNGRTLYIPYEFGNERFAEFMESKPEFFQSLLNQTFDLVILDELFGVHSFAIALHLFHFRAVPYIIYSTTMMIQSSAFALSLGRNFVAEPNLLTSPPADSKDRYRPRNLLNRLDNLRTIGWDLLRVQYQTEFFLNSQQSSLHILGVPNFSFEQFFSAASFTFADYLDRMPAPLAEGPDVLPISAHCAPAKPLPPELADFMEDPASNGTIFVAFGTNVHWRFAPAEMVRHFFHALNRLTAHRVIFVFNGVLPTDFMPGSHLKVLAWAPQADILAHPTTKLFISHAGLKSFKEILCAKMPAVFMPVYAEQSYNTKVALRLGFATAVNKLTLTQKALDLAIEKILANYAHFKRNAVRANAFFLDRPMDGLGMAEFGVRRAIKMRGRTIGKWRTRKGIHLDTFTHMHADLVLAILGMVLLLAWH